MRNTDCFNFGLNIFAGPQMSYLLDNKYTGTFDGDKDTEWDTEYMNRLDLGLVGSVGYRIDNRFSLNANYDLGLSRLDEDRDFKIYNRVFKFSIGYRFK